MKKGRLKLKEEEGEEELKEEEEQRLKELKE